MVGRPVRHSGSRPLLLNEILEHWVDEILPTCLLRWSRQAGCSSSELEHQVREAYQQVCVCVCCICTCVRTARAMHSYCHCLYSAKGASGIYPSRRKQQLGHRHPGLQSACGVAMVGTSIQLATACGHSKMVVTCEHTDKVEECSRAMLLVHLLA